MIGIDLVDIKRFANHSTSFAKKILSDDEYQKYLTSENQDLFLARSWAIKEAIFKADNQFYSFKNINLKKINQRWSFENFEISISHESNMLIAIAMKKE